MGFVNRWVESGRVSTTPPPTRSSPLWNGRSCPGMSSLTPTSPGRRGRLVLRVPQHQASSQLGCDDVTGRLRDNHPCARSGGGRTEPSTILGEAHVARCRWCPHPEDTSRGGDCGRSERAGALDTACAGGLSRVGAGRLQGVRPSGAAPVAGRAPPFRRGRRWPGAPGVAHWRVGRAEPSQ